MRKRRQSVDENIEIKKELSNEEINKQVLERVNKIIDEFEKAEKERANEIILTPAKYRRIVKSLHHIDKKEERKEEKEKIKKLKERNVDKIDEDRIEVKEEKTETRKRNRSGATLNNDNVDEVKSKIKKRRREIIERSNDIEKIRPKNMKEKRFKLTKDKLAYYTCLAVFVGSTGYIGKYFLDMKNGSKEIEDIVKIAQVEDESYVELPEYTAKEDVKENTPLPWNKEFMSVSFDKLKDINDETVGWIRVNGTNVNYPVVQASDNDFYLKNTFYKKRSVIGWIFADYRNDMQSLDFNTIIYGHSELLNDSMFTSLTSLLKKEIQEDSQNQIINFNTINLKANWQIFSIYKIDAVTDYLVTEPISSSDKENYIDMVTKRSLYNYNVNVMPTDKILTLSTCYGKKRLVVHAKLI